MGSTSRQQDELPTDPGGPTGKLCTWVDSVSLQDIPPEIQTRAKYLILDGLACGLTGAHLPSSTTAANAIFEMEPAGNSSAFGWNRVRPNFHSPNYSWLCLKMHFILTSKSF
jgi:aconitate decarboxylase